MCVIHCEYDQFMNILMQHHSQVFARVYVLQEGIAGIVYMVYASNHLYYLDRFFVSEYKKEEFQKISFFDVHKELYRIINLDENVRKINNKKYDNFKKCKEVGMFANLL